MTIAFCNFMPLLGHPQVVIDYNIRFFFNRISIEFCLFLICFELKSILQGHFNLSQIDPNINLKVTIIPSNFMKILLIFTQSHGVYFPVEYKAFMVIIILVF